MQNRFIESKFCQNLINNNIDIDQQIRGGKPRIKGTRIAVTDIIQLLEVGLTLEEILKELPSLENKEQIYSAIIYHLIRFIKIS